MLTTLSETRNQKHTHHCGYSRFLSAVAKKQLLSLATLLCATCLAAAQSVSLAGSWRFQLDRNDTGISEQWQSRALFQKVKLPGDLSEQGIGDPPSLQTRWIGGIQKPDWWEDPALAKYAEPDHFAFPYWLTPERRYMGAAWYQRDFSIPRSWDGKRVMLFLERPHWETQVWIDGHPIGTNNALGTPHEYDLGRLTSGKHVVTIRVDNRMIVDVGENSHSVSDHTQGNWNGIVGRLELRAIPEIYITDLQVYPNFSEKSFLVKGKLAAASDKADHEAQVGLGIFGASAGKTSRAQLFVPVLWNASEGSFEAVLKPAGDPQAWDEFTPNLYRILAVAGEDRRWITTGLREIATAGTQFRINGRPAFFRGTLECAIFPKTGYPPTDIPSWKRIINTCKAHGLNQIRFHSWCPPEAAFIAADELGFYLHVEASSWANQSTTLGDGKPIDAWIYAETDRILKYFGNHPSFVLMPYGNEPGGRNQNAYLTRWVEHYKAADPRRLFTSGAGWPQLPVNQFHVVPDPRIQAWGGGLNSRINALPPETVTDYRDYIQNRSVPVISHEIGQWCVYPNFAEIKKYTGYLKPRNFEIFRDSLHANHMGRLERDFLYASGKLQALCYKEDIESALRTPGMGGFQLLDLHDFPGQGTALVGVLDPFWEEKGYITPKEYSRFCNTVVPLARLTKRVFTTSEAFSANVEIANFSASPLGNIAVSWKLQGASGQIWAAGEFPAQDIPLGNGIAIGSIAASLKAVNAPAQGKLVVRVGAYENDWDIWVYPPSVDPPSRTTLITTDLDDSTLQQLENGARVLLCIPASRVRPDPRLGKIGLGFSSIFWNTAWTQRQPPHTLGILCDPKHRALADFPTDGFSNWQWWYLVHGSGALLLDDLPPTLEPTVRVIDDWVTNRRLGLLFEAVVGRGRIMVSAMDLVNHLEQDPVRAQLRHSILRYMDSKKFKPRTILSGAQVRSLITDPTFMQKLGARVRHTDSAEAGHEPENAIDGNPATFWHTRYRDSQPEFPHELQLELAKPIRLRGFAALPRQDRNPNGNIKDYAVYLSRDGQNWGSPVHTGSLPANAEEHTVTFQTPQLVRFFKLVALSGHAKGPWAAIAELTLLPAD